MDEIQLTAAGLGRWPAAETGDLVDGLAAVVERARSTVSATETRAAEMRSSGDFTRSGMTKNLELFVNQEFAALDAMSATALARARQDLALFERKLAAVGAQSAADSAASAIREAECRALLMDVAEQDRIGVVAEAISSGDELVLRAIFTAPAFWRARFVQPVELLDRWRDKWREGLNPDLAQKVRTLRAAITRTETALAGARSAIAAIPGLSEAARESLMLQGDPLTAGPLAA